jgi:hypothetical protein
MKTIEAIMSKWQVSGFKTESLFHYFPRSLHRYLILKLHSKLTLLITGKVKAINFTITFFQCFPNIHQSQHTFTVFVTGGIIYLVCFFKLTHFF